jgi:DNA polymerase I-like protein with 3'-5' exonuclease and polymerase domains
MTFPFTVNKHVSLATEMMQTRLKLNTDNFQLLTEVLNEEHTRCIEKVNRCVGRDLNLGSPKEVHHFLYSELRLKTKLKRTKDGPRPTADENALRELRVEYPTHRELLNAFIEERHIRKKIESYIQIDFDEDGYIPYSANPAGTETNRWSFSKSPRDRGLNAQTLPKVMRIMCDSPEGRIFLCPDLPQADARIVAWDAECLQLIELFTNPKIHFHLENCIRLFGISREEAYGKDEHGIAWKERDARYTTGKAMGHAANYRMAAKRLAMELGISVSEAQRLLDRYLHTLYPQIPRWHDAILLQVRRQGGLYTPAPFHRYRTFYKAYGELMLYGKVSTTTWNEACAYKPQSVVADIINVGMEKLWEGLDDVWFHKHDHDSYLASCSGDQLGRTVRAALDHLRVTLMVHGRPLTMVPEMQVGTNYGQLVEWKGEETLREIQPRLDVKREIDREKVRKDLYGYY